MQAALHHILSDESTAFGTSLVRMLPVLILMPVDLLPFTLPKLLVFPPSQPQLALMLLSLIPLDSLRDR
jgi:hypothetical protein